MDAAITQSGFSLARRRTRARMERRVRGRPGRFGRDAAAWCRRSRSRCQRRTVSGRTSSRSRRRSFSGSECSSAARNARSAGANRTLVPPSCRCSTPIWCRRARISRSLHRRRLCFDRPSVVGGAWRRYSSRPGRPDAAAWSIILPVVLDSHVTGRSQHPHVPAPTRVDGVFGNGKVSEPTSSNGTVQGCRWVRRVRCMCRV